MKDLNKLFAPIGLRVPEILLPARDIERSPAISIRRNRNIGRRRSGSSAMRRPRCI